MASDLGLLVPVLLDCTLFILVSQRQSHLAEVPTFTAAFLISYDNIHSLSSNTHIKESCPMLLIEPGIEKAKRGAATEDSVLIYQG